MKQHRHSPEFKEQALAKARDRGNRTLEAVAQEINISLGTLKGWLKSPRLAGAGQAGALELPRSGLAPAQWSAAQRLQALCSTYGLAGPELATWCREKGLFEHQLQQWRTSFCAMGGVLSGDRAGIAVDACLYQPCRQLFGFGSAFVIGLQPGLSIALCSGSPPSVGPGACRTCLDFNPMAQLDAVLFKRSMNGQHCLRRLHQPRHPLTADEDALPALVHRRSR